MPDAAAVKYQEKEDIPMIDLDKTNFEEEVLKAEGYVFVDFYGDGCVPVSYTHLPGR